MNSLVRRPSTGAAWANQKLDAAEDDNVLSYSPILGSFPRCIELAGERVEVFVNQVEANLEPIFAAAVGFRGGSISD